MTVTIEEVCDVYKGWTTLRKVMLTDGTKHFTREVEDHGNAVCVLPYDPDRRVVLLVELPRTPVLLAGGPDHLLEAPAGLIDDGEEEEACARREALEETGVELGELQFIARVWTSPGVSTERMALFLACYGLAKRTGAGGGLVEENENITVVERSLADLAALADAGELVDLKTLFLVQSVRMRRPDLFG